MFFLFTFSHLADAYVQSNLKWGQQKQSIVVLKQLKTVYIFIHMSTFSENVQFWVNCSLKV